MADATGYISAMKNSSDSDIAERFAKIGTFLKYYQLPKHYNFKSNIKKESYLSRNKPAYTNNEINTGKN